MRYILLASLLGLIDWFAYQAFGPLFNSFGGAWTVLLNTLYWSIPVLSMVFAIGAGAGWGQRLSRRSRMTLTASIPILYFSKFLTGVVILLDDIRRGGAWLLSSLLPELALETGRLPVMGHIGIFLGLMPAVLLIYGLIRNPYRYKVYRSDLRIPGLPDRLKGLRIVQISDIHTGSLSDKARVLKSVAMINDLDPDIVFFTGDLVNSVADEADPFIDVFKRIRARYGIFSIVGNHDYGDYAQWPSEQAKAANFEKLKAQHERLGWDLLLNAHRSVTIEDARIGIIGVENYSAHPRFQKYGDMALATSGMQAHDLTILLSHDPSHWEDEILKRYPDVDLTLSGHTHGFQFGVEMGKLFRWSPVQYVYKQWAGLYQRGNQYLYVNRGLGFLGYPGRVGILPEITLLTLEASGDSTSQATSAFS